MAFFTIFLYTLKQNARDRVTYLEMMLLPIVLIFILGMSLNQAFKTPSLNPIPTVLINEETGPLGENFNRFMGHEEVAQLLELVPAGSLEEGRRLVATGEAVALVHLPSDVLHQEKGKIRLVTGPRESVGIEVLESLLDTFVQGANTVLAMENMGVSGDAFRFRNNHLERQSLTAEEVLPGAMDYYAVTMLVMFLMYGTTYAVFGMKQSYLGFVGSRIRTTPISRAHHYLGLVTANLVTVMLQGIIIVTFTHVAYGVNWGTNLLLVLGVIFLTGTVAIGLGTAIVTITRDEVLAGNIVNILVPAMTFLSGGFFRFNPPSGTWMAALQYLSPNYLAQTALFTTIYGGDTRTTVTMAGGLGLMMMLSFAAALAAERRAHQ